MSPRLLRGGVVAAALAAGTLLLVVIVNTAHWVDTTFPGFFVMSNRVVPSIALPDWSDGDASRFFQHQVVAVDGVPVPTAAAVYEQVRQRAPGTPVEYSFRSPEGHSLVAMVHARRFSTADYVLIFGAYLLNGVAFLGTGLLVAYLKPRNAASLGLLAAGLTTGLFVTTAADLYGPYWFVRLHLLGESFLAPAFFHLALVFPTERVPRYRRRVLLGLYGAFALLAAAYEAVLGSPSAYTAVHLLATATHGLGALTIIAVVVYGLVTSPSALVRRRVSVVALGTLAAFLTPAVLMAASAFYGGKVPLNAGAFTAFLFPVSLAYAIVKQDLFEIDVMLRRATTYAAVVVVIGSLYLALLSADAYFLPIPSPVAQSPLALAILNLALLFLIAPVRARVQDGVDRLFFRKAYDAEQALSELSHALVSVHTLGEVVARTHAVMATTMCPASAATFLWEAGGQLLRAGEGDGGAVELTLPPALAERIERGEILARYEWDDGSGRAIPPVWHTLGAELLVPIRRGRAPMGALALGRKGSGRPYTMHDAAFLRAAASQIALAMTNAGAFARLESLNASLEQQVQERTASLAKANTDLGCSLTELRTAYQQLERNQASLMRAERLATLGRLTAGIAHEVNSPLGAVINSLKILTDLGREYADSIDDPEVTAADHHEIARELVQTAKAAVGWARKAAGFVGKVRIQGREPRSADAGTFEVATVVADVEALLQHRLRTSTCRLDFGEESRVTLHGDPARLGQVLINLVTNALDAYEDAGISDGRIEIHARHAGASAVLTVRDWAGGIPAAALPKIFDELFTTKDPTRGTGLGLSIARHLIEQSFDGTLTVETEAGVGSCFAITLPAVREQPSTAAAG